MEQKKPLDEEQKSLLRRIINLIAKIFLGKKKKEEPPTEKK